MSSDDEVEKYHKSKIFLNNDNFNQSDEETENFRQDREITHELVSGYLAEEKRKQEELLNDSEDEASEGSEDDAGKFLSTGFGSNKIKDFRGDDKLGKLSKNEQELAERARLEEAISKKRTMESMIENAEMDPELAGILEDGSESSDDEKTGDSETDAVDKPGTGAESGLDLTSLSDAKKLEIARSKYPNLEKYIQIYNQITQEIIPKIDQNLAKKAEFLTEILTEFLSTKRTILLDFVSTILFYLAVIFGEFEGEDGNVLKGHPVMIRLKRYEKIYEKYQNEEDNFCVLDGIIDGIEVGEEEGEEEEGELEAGEDEMVDEDGEVEVEKVQAKPVSSDVTKILEKIELKKRQKTEKLEAKKKQAKKSENVGQEPAEQADDKREITKEMAKNKGHVVSKKKKIDRNPRVKHREKFRKAKSRQRGQIKPMRENTGKYDGERGIRMGVTTGRKID